MGYRPAADLQICIFFLHDMGFGRIWFGALDWIRNSVQNACVKSSFRQFCDFLGFCTLSASKIIDFVMLEAARLPKHDQFGCPGLARWVPGGPRSPRRPISLILIEFHRFLMILVGFGAIWGRRLEQPVAACGNELQPAATPLR